MHGKQDSGQVNVRSLFGVHFKVRLQNYYERHTGFRSGQVNVGPDNRLVFQVKLQNYFERHTGFKSGQCQARLLYQVGSQNQR